MRLPFLRTLRRSEPAEPAPPPRYQGFIKELSSTHISGWLRSNYDEAERVEYQVVLPRTGEVLVHAQADHFHPDLFGLDVNQGMGGYYARLPRHLTAQELADLEVRAVGNGQVLERLPGLDHGYRPVKYFIMDLVDNCNLRCPFCIVDYSNVRTTHMMSDAAFDAAAQFAPFLANEAFWWFSCLHEPTLHPKLMDFAARVPFEHRRKIFFTTNLAKRMPDSFFAALAESGLGHVNISIESLDPAAYERMRKGARHRIFMENWDKLTATVPGGKAPPELRYIALAYRSTYRDLPAMVDHLLTQRAADQVDIRYTFDYKHLPSDFRQDEFLRRDDWLWLRDALAGVSPRVHLALPPGLDNPDFDATLLTDPDPFVPPEVYAANCQPEDPPPDRPYSRGHYGLRLFWDGTFVVNRIWGRTDTPDPVQSIRIMDITEAGDAEAFLTGLPT